MKLMWDIYLLRIDGMRRNPLDSITPLITSNSGNIINTNKRIPIV